MSIEIFDSKGRSLVRVPTVQDALLAFKRNDRAELAKDEGGRVVLVRPKRLRPSGPPPVEQRSLFGHIPAPKAASK